ncbi:MAG: MFS transporter [Chloroflexi bacterium HGW-Chloroflexi-10]|nr:MAG: MFS transporter [Chloroflexi bacterium HGW-Chloroflexi-10]
MWIKRLQLALIHVAVAMTLVPINSTLNRVMIKEMALSATLVSILAALPYLFSPIQVMIGSYADRHPIFGWRRTPYILLGLLLTVIGLAIAPLVVFIMPENFWLGLFLSMLVFGAWGLGYNFASVSYLSLASEISGEKERSKTIAVMFFFMISGIIATSIGLSHLLETYSPQILKEAFLIVALIALVLGLIGLIGLEKRQKDPVRTLSSEDRTPWNDLIRGVMGSSQARSFFIYLTVLLAAILGQDVLLEPFGAEAFGLSVQATTRITSIWGTCMLAALIFGNLVERWTSKKQVAQISAWLAIAGFVMITVSGFIANKTVFYSGVVLLGLGTGGSTVSNLSLMLDMTTERVGLFMGAWGVANALSRFLGTLMGGMVRDVATQVLQNPVSGYLVVFILEIILLVVSLFLLKNININKFKKQVGELTLSEKAALLGDSA